MDEPITARSSAVQRNRGPTRQIDQDRTAADRGVSTVFACLAVGLLLAFTAIGIRFGGAMLARQQAETAADLGALAGAARILEGSGSACARAGEVAMANRAIVTSCSADGLDLLIVVQVLVPMWGSSVLAHARAGPVTTG